MTFPERLPTSEPHGGARMASSSSRRTLRASPRQNRAQIRGTHGRRVILGARDVVLRGDLRETQRVPLPLHPRHDEPETRPVVEPLVDSDELRLGCLHAERGQRSDEETPAAREIVQFYQGPFWRTDVTDRAAALRVIIGIDRLARRSYRSGAGFASRNVEVYVMRWTSVILGALLSAGCSQITAYQPPNPCAPGVGQSQGGTHYVPTPHLVALGEGYTVVCE